MVEAFPTCHVEGPGMSMCQGGSWFSPCFGDFDPISLLDQGTNFDLCQFNPLGMVVRLHGFFVGKCVRVLDSTGLVTEAGVGWTSGVEVIGEERTVAVVLSSIEAETSWSMARLTRMVWRS